jgi:protein ImuA
MPADPFALRSLRHAVAEIEAKDTTILEERGRSLALGFGPMDIALDGGLAFGSLHEVAPPAPLHFAAAAGFVLALAVRSGKSLLWIQPEFAGHEAGGLYGPGLELFGLPLQRLLVLRVTRPIDALWAMEEALKCHALATVVAELANDGEAADLTTTRRLALAAREGGGLGLLLRHRLSGIPSAAATRWTVAATPSRPDAFGGFGRTAFDLSLVKNRRGPTGRWNVAWDQHEHTFSALPLGVAAAASDRPDRARLAHVG